MVVAAGNGQPETTNVQWVGYGQGLHSSKSVSLKGPGDFRNQADIEKVSSLGAWNSPTSPDRSNALPVSGRLDLIRSIKRRTCGRLRCGRTENERRQPELGAKETF